MLSKLAESALPYTAGEQPRGKTYIKLNTNENPYPPSPLVQAALDGFDTDRLRRYPDPACTELRDALAVREGVRRENIFVGNGSDEVLAFAFAALFDPGAPVLFADVTYSFYPVYCRLFGLTARIVPLRRDFTLHREGYANGGGIVIANPNAPTGVYEDVSSFIGASVPVIVDEAYIDFSGKPSLAAAAAKSKNAVVVKTFSKSFALAGARCGYAVANEEIIDGLFRIKDSFNSYTVNAVTQAAALAALRDTAYFAQRVQQVTATRETLWRGLQNKGYACLPSQANFVLASVPDGDARGTYLRLKENGVLVRFFDAPRLRDKLRITVGTPEETDALLRLL